MIRRAAGWLLYYLGVAVSKPMIAFESGSRLYWLYNWLMVAAHNLGNRR